MLRSILAVLYQLNVSIQLNSTDATGFDTFASFHFTSLTGFVSLGCRFISALFGYFKEIRVPGRFPEKTPWTLMIANCQLGSSGLFKMISRGHG